MKKNLIIILGLIIIGLALASGKLKAQEIDQKRMDRDIMVAQNILKNLMNEDGKLRGMGYGVKGEYLEGYGVVFTMPPASRLKYAIQLGDHFDWNEKGEEHIVLPPPPRSDEYIDQNEAEINEKIDFFEQEKEREFKEQRDHLDRKRTEIIVQKHDAALRVEGGGTIDSFDEMIESWKVFLVDYADLIGQLHSTDKIMIKMSDLGSDVWVFAMKVTGEQLVGEREKVSAEISKSDLIDYKKGKINRDEVLGKVKIVKKKLVEVERDIKIFGGIIDALYSSNTSETYFTSGNIRYERMEDFGVVLDVKFYSSNPSGFGETQVHYMPTRGKRDLSQAERDEEVIKIYPEFERELKNNIVEYGKTISSLGEKEKLIIKTHMTACAGCGIPDIVEFAVEASVLMEYANGKISKKEAINRISVKKQGKQ